jgi:hypothetical protein
MRVDLRDSLPRVRRRLGWRLAGVSRIGAARDLDVLKVLAAESSVQRIRGMGRIASLSEVELRVFSQFGDDGIIQYLISHLPLVDTFVEFGVADYRESNTRFLLVHDNWRGLVMDASAENVNRILADDVAWRHALSARAAFITRDNINDLLKLFGFEGRIGILHIDIDGNDYWIWEAIEVIEPEVVIVEYNAVFGASHRISVPYDPEFRRELAHFSWLFCGASLPAFTHLGGTRGYRFIGCNSAGNNAYFVKQELADDLPDPGIGGFVTSRFRESRAPDGSLSFLAGEARREAIADMEVVDVVTSERTRLGEL